MQNRNRPTDLSPGIRTVVYITPRETQHGLPGTIGGDIQHGTLYRPWLLAPGKSKSQRDAHTGVRPQRWRPPPGVRRKREDTKLLSFHSLGGGCCRLDHVFLSFRDLHTCCGCRCRGSRGSNCKRTKQHRSSRHSHISSREWIIHMFLLLLSLLVAWR